MLLFQKKENGRSVEIQNVPVKVDKSVPAQHAAIKTCCQWVFKNYCSKPKKKKLRVERLVSTDLNYMSSVLNY